jgi:hypothetical protein
VVVLALIPWGPVGKSGCRSVVSYWYHVGVAMTLRLDDQDNEALRRQAEVEQRSMHAVAQDAIREYINQRAHRTVVDTAIRSVVARHADLLRRLGE